MLTVLPKGTKVCFWQFFTLVFLRNVSFTLSMEKHGHREVWIEFMQMYTRIIEIKCTKTHVFLR